MVMVGDRQDVKAMVGDGRMVKSWWVIAWYSHG